MSENLLKMEVSLGKIFFPKRATSVQTGEYAIFVANVQKLLEDTEYDNYDIKLKGTVPLLEYGATYKVHCVLSEHNEKYGDTYEIIFISRIANLDNKDSQRLFLEHIIPENTVDELFKKYDDVISLLENKDVKALCQVKGIKTKTAYKLISRYEDTKDYSKMYVELGQLGLSPTFIKSLVEHYKSPEVAIQTVRDDPYSLVEMDGIGFKKADEVAQLVGVEQFDVRRVKGFLLHHLKTQAEAGQSYLWYQQLMEALGNNLGFVPEGIINEAAKQLLNDGKIISSPDGMKISLYTYFNLEKNILSELVRLQIGKRTILEDENPMGYTPRKMIIENPDETIKEVEREQGYDFTEEQLNAIHTSIHNNVIAITGIAGSGKSATAKGICALFKDTYITACALSGKAALRITEATGFPASTIHRALCWTGRNGFEFNKDAPLHADIVLIDEATMINGPLFYALLSAIPTGAKVIMLGDINQLTPLGSCQVFGDILAANAFPTIRLTKPHRQALRSGIIPTSISISKQEQIFNSNYEGEKILGELQDMELIIKKPEESLLRTVIEKFQEQLNKFKDILEVQVCVPMRVRGELSCYSINNAIQNIVNPNFGDNSEIVIELPKNKNEKREYHIRVKDKVINRKNNYKVYTIDGDQVAVFNGNIGIVKEINDEDKVAIIDFQGIGEIVFKFSDCKNLELAYACTVHSLQGSGFLSTIVAIDNSSFIMNNCELLYTAVTRAKKYCVLISHNYPIQKCINSKEVNTKQTFLKEMLLENKELFQNQN